jgi:hypothetical protein
MTTPANSTVSSSNGISSAAAKQTRAQHEAQLAENEAMKIELARLRGENAALKARKVRAKSLKVSEKGAASLYGLGRFPVTLYKEQWVVVLDMADEIRAFLVANDAKLKGRDDVPANVEEVEAPAKTGT